MMFRREGVERVMLGELVGFAALPWRGGWIALTGAGPAPARHLAGQADRVFRRRKDVGPTGAGMAALPRLAPARNAGKTPIEGTTAMAHAPEGNLTAKQWSVRIFISEHDGTTRALARLDSGAGTNLTGTGLARLSPKDNDVPEIGDELAAARALVDLSARLLQAADGDVEEVTGLRRDSIRDTAWSS